VATTFQQMPPFYTAVRTQSRSVWKAAVVVSWDSTRNFGQCLSNRMFDNERFKSP